MIFLFTCFVSKTFVTVVSGSAWVGVMFLGLRPRAYGLGSEKIPGSSSDSSAAYNVVQRASISWERLLKPPP